MSFPFHHRYEPIRIRKAVEADAGVALRRGRWEAAAPAPVAPALTTHPDLSIELIANEPGWSNAEHQRFIDTMQLAGFPSCAKPEALAKIVKPLRLPECVSH